LSSSNLLFGEKKIQENEKENENRGKGSLFSLRHIPGELTFELTFSLIKKKLRTNKIYFYCSNLYCFPMILEV